MDFWGTIVVLFRRWYITLTAFALAVAAALGVYTSIPTTYESTVALVLVSPVAGGEQAVKSTRPRDLFNPLLNFDKGLSVSATIVVAALETPEMQAELGVSPTGDPTYIVNNGSNNPESLTLTPFVFITGHSTSPEKARAIAQRVMDRAERVLADHQKALGVPSGTYITMDTVTPPTTPYPLKGGKLRSAAVALAMGGVASLAAVYAFESAAQARRRRREAADENGRRRVSPATMAAFRDLPLGERPPVGR